MRYDKEKILVGVCSCISNRYKRMAVRQTWKAEPVENVECVFFLGRTTDDFERELDTIALNCNDSYDHLPGKVLAFFVHALANFDFDWLFKCDDDTYLALDRLHNLIEQGYDFIGNKFLAERGAPDGGAGYLLSRNIVAALVTDLTIPKIGPEDIIIGRAAVRLGARPFASQLLNWNCQNYPSSDNCVISAHHCTAERQKAIHTIRYDSPIQRFIGVHVDWTDEVYVFANGIFFRKTSRCCGIWRETKGVQLVLSWFDWEDELLIFDGTNYQNSILKLSEYKKSHFESLR